MLNYKAIGRRIAYHRKRAYFTQATLAEKLDISESYLSQVECGKAKVSLERLNHIAETINVDISFLLSDSNPSLETYGLVEFIEIFRHWNPKQKEFLLNLLKCANEQLSSMDK